MLNRNRISTFLIQYKCLISIAAVMLVVIGFYFYNFHSGLSKDNGVWGTFGDYVGGILNPIIAAFAFYLIAKTYELQKTELEETRKLLINQTELAALTSWINSNLLEIEFLQSRKSVLWKEINDFLNDEKKLLEIKQLRFDVMCGRPSVKTEEDYENPAILEQYRKYDAIEDTYSSLKKEYEIDHLVDDIDIADSNINSLQDENDKLKSKIKSFIPDQEKLKGFPPYYKIIIR